MNTVTAPLYYIVWQTQKGTQKTGPMEKKEAEELMTNWWRRENY